MGRSGLNSEVENLLKMNLASLDTANSSLFAAVSYNHSEIVELFLEFQANPNIAREDGTTPLYLATQMNRTEIMRTLLKARADPEICTAELQRPITKAVEKGHVAALKLLINFRADVNGLGHKKHQTALDSAYAIMRNLEATGVEEENARCIVDVLLEAGAVDMSLGG